MFMSSTLVWAVHVIQHERTLLIMLTMVLFSVELSKPCLLHACDSACRRSTFIMMGYAPRLDTTLQLHDVNNSASKSKNVATILDIHALMVSCICTVAETVHGRLQHVLHICA